MSDEVSLPTEDDLKRLSLRACVAYAVRASLRVRPLYRSGDAADVQAVDAANRIAMQFVDARATDIAGFAANAVAAHAAAVDIGDEDTVATSARCAAAFAAAAASDASVTASSDPDAHPAAHRAYTATTAAAEAAECADTATFAAQIPASTLISEFRSDYEKLLEFSGDAAGELGDPFDLESLGALWSQNEPEWFRAADEKHQMPSGEASIVEPVYVPEDRQFGVLPNEDALRLLSQRACVAYAVRASLRVRPLFHSDDPAHEEAVDAANKIAIFLVGNRVVGADAHRIAAGAHAAAKAAANTGDDVCAFAASAAAFAADAAAPGDDIASAARKAALNASYAAEDGAAETDVNDTAGAETYGSSVLVECGRDYKKLLGLSGQDASGLGARIDVESDRGPLGPLWPDGEPQWFRERSGNVDLLPFDQLEQLSLRAAVAYAWRAALRVRPLFPNDDPAFADVVDRAIDAARATVTSNIVLSFASEKERDAVAASNAMRVSTEQSNEAASFAASAAANAADSASQVARQSPEDVKSAAFTAADHAKTAASCVGGIDAADDVVGGMLRDFEALREQSLFSQGELGKQIDLDRLGPLWPKGEPEWFSACGDEVDSDFLVEPLEFLVDPGSASAEEIADVYAEIKRLYRVLGGEDLEFRLTDCREPIPAGDVR
ncbi:MAG: hypothetical protein IID44_21660 [Planctomycetes bacterium]|nr:hypothetical protein [Planctomycetota bacterium]